jgi:hypothetical protein
MKKTSSINPSRNVSFHGFGQMIVNNHSINLLFLVALSVDLFTPFLIWKGIIPAATRWISYGATITMMVGVYLRMMTFDRIPKTIFVVLWFSLLGICISYFYGQNLTITAWGWLRMFEFIFVGLFAYLEPNWPNKFPQRLRTICIAIFGLEILVQIGQYIMGLRPGDDMAGLFGWHGDQRLQMFIIWVLCLAFGVWLAKGYWHILILVICMGIVSGVLAELKFYIFATAILGIFSFAVYFLCNHNPLKLLLIGFIMALAVWGFFIAYDLIVPGAKNTPLESYLNLSKVESYRNVRRISDASEDIQGYTVIGRNYGLAYGWDMIKKDPITLLFGFGLGSRSESRSLGVVGSGLEEGDLGLTTGSSLVIMMYELGLIGLLGLSGFILMVTIELIKGIRNKPHSDILELQYALLMFTLLWPLWLWYSTVWSFRVTMLLYWITLGYVISQQRKNKTIHEGLKRVGVQIERESWE